MYDNLKKRIERSAAGSKTDNQDLRICVDMIRALERVSSPSKRDRGVWTEDEVYRHYYSENSEFSGRGWKYWVI